MAEHTTDDALRHADGMCDPMSAAYIRGLVDLVESLAAQVREARLWAEHHRDGGPFPEQCPLPWEDG